MRIVFFCCTCFLALLVNIVEGSGGKKPRCVTCGTIAKDDDNLKLKYCPYCVQKHQASWRYFIKFNQTKHKHVNESYESQYTCLDFMIGITPRKPWENYVEKVFLEFISAVWCKLKEADCSFRNPDLQSLFLALVEKEEEASLDYEQLFQFYCELKWICLALYYECDSKKDYEQNMHEIFKEIDKIIRILLCYIEKSAEKLSEK